MNIKLVAVALTLVLFVSGGVLAQSGVGNNEQIASANTDESDQRLQSRKQQIEEKRRALEERLQNRSARKCELVKVRLESQRDKTTEIRVHRKTRYQHIVDRLNAMADRLDRQDIDSASLRSAITELTELIATFDAGFAEYEASLQAVINEICSDDKLTDRQSLRQARQLLASLRSNAESIHTFFREDLKPLLAEIKVLVASEQNSADTEDDL